MRESEREKERGRRRERERQEDTQTEYERSGMKTSEGIRESERGERV